MLFKGEVIRNNLFFFFKQNLMKQVNIFSHSMRQGAEANLCYESPSFGPGVMCHVLITTVMKPGGCMTHLDRRSTSVKQLVPEQNPPACSHL